MVLPHVGDVEIAGLAIERKPPRIAEPVRPDLGRERRVARAGIVRRDRVAARATHIEPQQLAEQRVLVLSLAIRITAPSPVPRPRTPPPHRTHLPLATR